MVKKAVLGFFTLLVFSLMGYTASQGRAYHGGEHGKVIENIDAKVSGNSVQKVDEKDDRQKELDALKSLKDKAGSAIGFKVSNNYKSKCSSCHGINGSGTQNGKNLIGTKLIGLSKEKILKDLKDFKDGRRENLIMKGLLIPMEEAELIELAEEISDFQRRQDEAQSNKQPLNNANKYDMSAW